MVPNHSLAWNEIRLGVLRLTRLDNVTLLFPSRVRAIPAYETWLRSKSKVGRTHNQPHDPPPRYPDMHGSVVEEEIPTIQRIESISVDRSME